MNARMYGQVKAASVTSSVPARSGVLQRACACGQHTGAGGECAECRQKREEKLQRAAVNDARVNEVPPIVHEVLRSPGQPLDPATRSFMQARIGPASDRPPLHATSSTPQSQLAVSEPGDRVEREASRLAEAAVSTPAATRLAGWDFSRVRVHADEKAAQSARSVHSLAYTVGNHVVFGAGQYLPGTGAGQRLLAHELAHTIQQGGADPGASTIPASRSGLFLARQCDPAWAGLGWDDRVTNAKAMAGGAAKNQCVTDMMDEALYPNVTVHQSTNTAASVGAAITAGRYTEWGTLSDLQVNFDNNLTAKTGAASQYGQTEFRQPTPNEIDIYIMLGPNALNPVGPDFTRMAFDHESSHATDFLIQFATGTPHAATAGEELTIYAEGFSHYFLDMWTIDSTACTWNLTETFQPLSGYYASAAAAEQDSGFESIKMFYEVRIQGIPCNEMKFKIWLQSVMNARPASDALIARINALPGLGLTRGTAPNTHWNCALGCT